MARELVRGARSDEEQVRFVKQRVRDFERTRGAQTLVHDTPLVWPAGAHRRGESNHMQAADRSAYL